MNILPLLVERGIIEESDVAAILEEATAKGQTVEEVLESRGVHAETILSVKGDHLQVPTRTVPDSQLPFEILQIIPEESAKHYGVVPLAFADGALEVGMVDPDNIEAIDALNFITAKSGKPYKTFLISEADFNKVLGMYQGMGGDVDRALQSITEEAEEGSEAVALASSVDDDEGPATKEEAEAMIEREDAPVTKIVATMIRNAVDGRASDIHIESNGEKVRVRFRVDGTLHTSILLPAKVHRAIVSRIKILSQLKLDERRKPQDGRFSATIEGRKVDFRVSTFPTHYGEKVVLRILDSEKGITKLDDLGLSETHAAMVREAVQKPYGMILVTGPTGSGKSTTLYSMLSEVDTEGKNVLSLEDPVEYNIKGMSQSQVRPEIGYTFASGLRSILRQDPDIIMVGEIRDKETAQLAVQAALTGHLVLSTLHTNTALGAVPRLIDMGVDPYLIAPTLELLIGQRLVRKLCPGSGRKIPLKGSVKNMVDQQFADLPEEFKKDLPLNQDFTWGLQPSGDCPSGTRGRTAVHEMVTVDREFEDAILNDADENQLYDIARKRGMMTMKEAAILKSFRQEVPFEEINTLGGSFISENDPLDEEGTTAEGQAEAPTEKEEPAVVDEIKEITL